MKLSVKLLSGLAFIALVTVAVVGLSNSASAAVDGKIYVTNVASNLTTEPGQTFDDDGRTTATTVYGTYPSHITTGVTARDIVSNSDVFIVTVVDSDLNTTTTVTSEEDGTAGFDTTGALGTNLSNVVGDDFDAPGDRINVTLADTNTSPVVGTIDDIRVISHNTSTDVTRVSVVAIAFVGNGINPAIITLQLDFGGSLSTRFDIQYPTSSVEEITATIKSVVDTGGTSVVTLTETGRDTGRFEGFVRVKERVATGGSVFITGAPGTGLSINAAATIPAIGGPISITYNDADTSGTAKDVTRTATLTIDVQPPTATISAPVSGSESQNRLPTFTGNVTDNQSGLDVSGFALFVHEAADAANTILVITAGNNLSAPTINGIAASIDVSALSDGANTLAFSHTQTVILPTGIGTDVPDHIVDFQVQALDLAGNFGYSDSDTALGNIEGSGRHGNQPHTIKIDQVLPSILTAETGIGLDTSVSPTVDKENVRDTIKVTFDGNIKDSSVSPSDFQVVFDGAGGTFVPASVIVKDAVVYLDLDTTIPSDNKPTVKIQGTIQDLAGNSTDAGSAVADDKLAPVITVTRSGGTGTGTDSEAADSLTSDKLTITVTADEDLQGPPAITITDIKSDGTPVSSVGNVNNGTLGVAQGGNTWTLVITKGTSAAGDRAVSVASTDSAGTTADSGADDEKAYVLDLIVEAPLSTPDEGGTTTQSNPFLTTDFTAGGTAEQSTVSVVSATLQEASLAEVDVTSSVVASADSKTFFFQPTAALANAEHTYVLKVKDAAGNESTTTVTFTKSDRSDFVLELFAGWNVVSVPSNPLVTDIGSVLTNTGIKQVVAFDATTPSQPWRIASKVGSGPYSSQTTPGLTAITAGPGYWIETSDFEDQKIALEGEAGPGDARPGLTTIATGNGWNLVGVVDQSRKQTQSDNKGKTLTRPNADGSGTTNVTVATYFNTVNNGRAYVFSTVQSQFNELATADTVTIGSGIWVFISPQTSGDLPPIVP
ncbi:MAG: hypothetical protein IIA53_05580 [Chloroflexi bacterium]|nr:hypothetical protein [Chloroflexota bacterium]